MKKIFIILACVFLTLIISFISAELGFDNPTLPKLISNSKICSGDQKVSAVKLTDFGFEITCSTDQTSNFSEGIRNSFDQSLNTTDDVKFNDLNLTGDILPLTDSSLNIGSILLRWLLGWFDNIVVGSGNFTTINTDELFVEDYSNVTIEMSQVNGLQGELGSGNFTEITSNDWSNVTIEISQVNGLQAELTRLSTYGN